MHTDVLKEKYGQIKARVIRHDDLIRESHLIDNDEISRTYTITFFPLNGHQSRIAEIDSEIRKSNLIGETFRKYGFAIRKNVIDVSSLEIPTWLKQDFQTEESFAKARLSEFYAKQQGSSPTIYGTVLEVYSPDFRSPVINNTDINQVNPTTSAFEKVGFTKDQIWVRIGNDNDWSDVQTSVSEAKRKSLEAVFELKRRVNIYLAEY